MLDITFSVNPTPQAVINRERNNHKSDAMIAANNAIAAIEYNPAGLVSLARRYYRREVQTYKVYEYIRHNVIANYDDLTDDLNGTGYRFFSRRVAIALADLVDAVHRAEVAQTTTQIASLRADNAELQDVISGHELRAAYAERRDEQQTNRIEALEEALMGLLTAQGVVEGTEDYQRAREALGL